MSEEVVKVNIALNTSSAGGLESGGGGSGGGSAPIDIPANNFVTHQGSIVRYDWDNFGLLTYEVPE